MISVVIPLYNKAATIERAVRSVLSQTVQDFELIVVNNGSTDGGEEVVKQIHDERLRLVEQDNKGVSMARNRGVAESQYDYVAFLDADDEWSPQFLEQSLSLQKEYPECDIYASAYVRCTPDGILHPIHLSSTFHLSNTRNNTCILDNYFEVAASSDPPFCSISVMIRKKALLSIGGFPEGVHQGEDLLTWARLAANGTIAYCITPQSIFYISSAQSNGRPKRIPDPSDPVGKELQKLHNLHPDKKGLSEYLSLWHKMRASIYLRLPKSNKQCRKELRLSRHWNKKRNLLSYLFLTYIPYPIRMKLLQSRKTD